MVNILSPSPHLRLETFIKTVRVMSEPKKQPDPAKVDFLRSLPVDIKASITGEEAEQFMFGDEIPESLYHKIKDYLLESDE